MRLLIISHSAETTGAPISALQLAKEFKKKGVDLRIILRRGGPLTEQFEAAAPVFVWRPSPSFTLVDMAQFAQRHDPIMVAKCLRNPDRPYCLSSAEQSRAAAIVAQIQAWAPDAIYANTTHCGDVIDFLEIPAPIFSHVRELAPSIAALDTKRRRSALEKTKFFFCASQRVADDLADEFYIARSKLGVEPPAVAINNADIPGATKIASDVEDRFGLSGDDRLIIGAGTLTPRKGPDLFFEAAAAALKHYTGRGRLMFIWIGDGVMRRDLEVRARAEELGDRLLFPGAVTDPLPFFRRAAALLVTSIEDPYPRVAIEAAAMGAQILAFSDGGGAADLIGDFNAGFVIDGFNPTPMGERAAELAAAWAHPDTALSERIIAVRSIEKSAARIILKIGELT